MTRTRSFFRRPTWALAALAIAVTGATMSAACVDETLAPLSAAATGGDGGSGGDNLGGTGGTADPDRGDPPDFPEMCVATCEEACSQMAACGSADATFFGMSELECLSLCPLAEGGPFWGDISANFKCCASQTDCDAAQHCGGWLAHPDSQQSCQKLCGCLNGSSAELAALADGHVAPAPYRFADHAVMLDGRNEHTTNPRDALPIMRDAWLTRSGAYVKAQLGPDAGPHTVAKLASLGTLLPTFVDSAGRVSAATGRVFVRVAAPGTQRVSASLLSRATSVLKARTPVAPTKVSHSKTLYTHVFANPWDAVDAVNELRAVGLNAELDMLREYRMHYTPNDPLFPDQWHLRNTGQDVSTEGVDARVSEAWDITRGDPQVLIAINDDGTDIDHPDFAGRLEPELNYPSDWRDLLAAFQFGQHGTPVAGVTAAGADDTVGGAGVCPNCRIIPHLLALVSPDGSFQLSDGEAAAGFERQVDAGAWIINNSWGVGLGEALHADAEQQGPSIPSVMQDAFDYAENTGRGGLGTIIVFAAGNENTGSAYHVTSPTTVGVAAVGDVGLKAYYSCFGPSVDVAAPSNGALAGITTSAAQGGQTNNFGGTSSASPLVAGVLGLILSRNPALTAAEARDILRASATPIDPVFGAYDQDGHSPYYGHGMVNAYVAVQMADGSCTTPADCLAPSDECGAHCGTRTTCDPCRTQDDCAEGHVCQSLASLGRTVCVAEKGQGACADGTVERNGHCLPLPETCGLCQSEETCNGRDDNCDGQADEDNVCQGAPRCFIDGPACAEGTACAGTSCVPTCETTDDCEDGAICHNLKDQYGNTEAKGCLAGGAAGGCQAGCQVLASSLDDEGLQGFNDCMQNGLVDCGTAQGCAVLLPVEF